MSFASNRTEIFYAVPYPFVICGFSLTQIENLRGRFFLVKPLKPRDPNLFDIWVKYWAKSNVQRPTLNAQHPTPKAFASRRPIQNVDSAVQCSAFDACRAGAFGVGGFGVRRLLAVTCRTKRQSRIDYDCEHEHELATASPSAGGHDSCDIRSLRGSNPYGFTSFVGESPPSLLQDYAR